MIISSRLIYPHNVMDWKVFRYLLFVLDAASEQSFLKWSRGGTSFRRLLESSEALASGAMLLSFSGSGVFWIYASFIQRLHSSQKLRSE